LIRGLGFGGVGPGGWAQDVALDFVFDDLRHEAVDRPSACGYLLQDHGAILVLLYRILDSVELSLKAVNTDNQFFLVGGDVAQCADLLGCSHSSGTFQPGVIQSLLYS